MIGLRNRELVKVSNRCFVLPQLVGGRAVSHRTTSKKGSEPPEKVKRPRGFKSGGQCLGGGGSMIRAAARGVNKCLEKKKKEVKPSRRLNRELGQRA